MKTKLLLLSCLLLTSNAVFASFEPVRSNHVETQQWSATHAGETSIDGMDVIAILEVAQVAVNLDINSILPMDPIYRKMYRVSLIPVNQSDIRVKYSLRSTSVASTSGRTLNAFVNEDANQDFQFMIVDDGSGSLHAQFKRKIGSEILQSANFELLPAVSSF